MIHLTIPGPPIGKQRARVCRSGHAFTPAKTVNDALSGLAFVDDKQIISVYAEKKYSLRPCVEVILAEP
jgi:hypothetical protein